MRYDTGEPHIRHGVHNPFRHDAAGVWRAARTHSVVTHKPIGKIGETLPTLSSLVMHIQPLVTPRFVKKPGKEWGRDFATPPAATYVYREFNALDV